jgi:hypothetical protein
MSLTRKEASIVMGMLSRGDKNQDIAAWFGENPARIVEIAKGETYGNVPAAARNKLPPRGAIGPKARMLHAYAVDALKLLKKKRGQGVAEAIKELAEGISRFNKNEK